MTLLIVSADDGGIHPAIDRGILRCLDEGPVTSVAVAVSGSSAPDLIHELSRRDNVGIGLHLTLTGLPAIASTRLAMAGEALPRGWASLARRLARGAVGRDDVARELEAQIHRARGLGLAIDHVVSREHVHLLPGISDLVARVLIDADLPRAVRIQRRPRAEVAKDPRAFALRAASSFARRTAYGGFRSPERVVSVPLGPFSDLGEILFGLAEPMGSVEFVVHPGDEPRFTETALPESEFNWPDELAALLARDWRSSFSERFRLGTYRDLS